MGYTGYSQYLCQDGHLSEVDATYEYYSGDENEGCRCGQRIVWENSVDTTNGREI